MSTREQICGRRSSATSANERRRIQYQMGLDHDERTHDVECWVRHHQVGAWRHARLRGCPPDVADDLVQEALMAALHKGIPAEPDPAAAAWLRGAIDNLWRMYLRTEGRRQRHAKLAAVDCTWPFAGAEDDGGAAWLDALRACLERLDGRARRLLDLHYGVRASRVAIAGELGLRANGVKALLRRVRDGLRACVLRRLAAEGEPR
ncbi:MAG: hypothetical protein KDC98_21960 [Planctomycetes bacterium]|nr:hypothetical protein [Planctomycetota bacterium]